MKADDLYHLMDNPSLMSEETLLTLRKMVEVYPNFQVARMLYLKNLSLLNDPRFSVELDRLIYSLPDRKHLFRYIQGEKYSLEGTIEKKKNTSADKFSLIDAFLSDRKEEVEMDEGNTLLFQPSASSDYLYWSLTSKEDKQEGKKEDVKQLRHQDLIDSFIENDQQRTPGSGLDLGDASENSVVPESVQKLEEEPAKTLEDSCLTETLARIYIKQKRYDKALQIIKNLNLKYPEKNVYFADQIRFLEKLIINTKK